jgi:hypothetical protein
MKLEKHCDGNVLIFEEFLTEDETKALDSFMRNFDYENLKEHQFKYWGKRLINQHEMHNNPGYENAMDGVNPLLEAITQRTKDVLNTYDHQAEWIPTAHNLIKMFPGSATVGFQDDDKLEMFVHIDNQGHMENPIMWGSVLYINDDYEGGEIYYPDYEFWYKPKPGSMALHEGNTRHGVKKVTQGNRFCAASLVTIDGVFNQNPLPTRTDDPSNPYFYPPGYWGKRIGDDPIQGDVKVPRRDGTTAPYNDSPVLAKADR